MKVVILAGGFGTRMSEETGVKPKPMVEIGGRPILWHIMKIYSEFGFNEFIILLGYKGYVIKEFFSNYFLHQSDVTIDLADNSVQVHQNESESWKVTLLDTGLNTMTGGRIKQAEPFIGKEDFLLTYGDGLSDVNISNLVAYHNKHGKILTMTAVQPDGRYGVIDIKQNNLVSSFKEKPKSDDAWINGGFFVCKPEVLKYIDNDATIFEQEPLVSIAKNNELAAFKHLGFWKCMDSVKDMKDFNALWEDAKPPWKVW
jgi:glucose-1-phosphate cytidylyltransferase